MIALDLAPSKLCEKSQFLRLITKDLIARSAILLDKSRLPSLSTALNVSPYLRLYSMARPNLEPGRTACLRHQSKNYAIKGSNSSWRFSVSSGDLVKINQPMTPLRQTSYHNSTAL